MERPICGSTQLMQWANEPFYIVLNASNVGSIHPNLVQIGARAERPRRWR